MKTVTADVAVVGGGPAGMCAALQAAQAGAHTILIDENSLPGGQLFKQIHKFFGSRDHKAGTRGFTIGTELLKQVQEAGVEVWLDSLVYGIQKDRSLGIIQNGKNIVVNVHVTLQIYIRLIKSHNNGYAQFQYLGGEKQTPSEIGGIHDIYYYVRLFIPDIISCNALLRSEW